MQWHGSDVLTLKTNLEKKSAFLDYIKVSESFTDASWLRDELRAMDVQTELLHFKHVIADERTDPFLSGDVVSYFAQGKEKFYGVESIERLAVAFPQITFHIAGSNGSGRQHLQNIVYYGWIEKTKLAELINTHAIYLRLTEHDGYSLSVLEAIANGNYVLWNNPHPGVCYLKSTDDLHDVFSALVKQVSENKLGRLVQHKEWVKKNHQKELVLKNYVDRITQ